MKGDSLEILHRDFIYVWRVELGVSETVPEAQHASCRSLLSIEEKHRANAFRREGSRRDYTLTHAALRCVLGHYLEIPPAKVQFATSSAAQSSVGRRKPALLAALGSEAKQADLRFNLSHTKGVALIGVTLGRELGVDIEWRHAIDDLDVMARRVMSDEELAQWQILDLEDQTRAFYNLWTRKESYLKAIGIGLFRNLQDISVPVLADRLVDTHDQARLVLDRAGAGHWSVNDLSVEGSYSASVCCEGSRPPTIIRQDFDLDSLPAY